MRTNLMAWAAISNAEQHASAGGAAGAQRVGVLRGQARNAAEERDARLQQDDAADVLRLHLRVRYNTAEVSARMTSLVPAARRGEWRRVRAMRKRPYTERVTMSTTHSMDAMPGRVPLSW